MRLVSIIVPVHNAQSYLDRSIRSLLEQTYEDVEVILVDDGSSDRSPEICQEYERSFDRITLLQQHNCGPSAARNLGLSRARGEYICFADADDWAEPTMVEYLVAAARQHDSDFVFCGYRLVRSEVVLGERSCAPSGPKSIVETRRRILATGTLNAPWAKLYLRSIVTEFGLRFDEELSYGEDAVFNLNYLRYVVRPYCTAEMLYNYRYYNNSLSRRYRGREMGMFLKQMELKLDLVSEWNFRDDRVLGQSLLSSAVQTLAGLLLVCARTQPFGVCVTEISQVGFSCVDSRDGRRLDLASLPLIYRPMAWAFMRGKYWLSVAFAKSLIPGLKLHGYLRDRGRIFDSRD